MTPTADRAARKRTALQFGGIVAAVAAGVVGVTGFLDHSLYAPTFVTGWILAAGLLAVAVFWWSPPADERVLARRARRQLGVAIAFAGLFGVHVEWRAPLGWLQVVLFGAFVLLLASSLTGVLSVARNDETSIRRWLRFHVPFVWVLLSISVFHGSFSHLHGALAHWFL